jgi:N-acetyl-anhydromuramyl-L-alanine amidase AmpD
MVNEPSIIIVHCSDSDVPAHDNIETIDRWHKQRGWKMVGYHYVITKDGEVHPGRPESAVGAHCKGQNIDSLGICLTGRNEFSQEQLDSAERLFNELCSKYDIDPENILPHNHFDESKTCPNLTWRIHYD